MSIENQLPIKDQKSRTRDPEHDPEMEKRRRDYVEKRFFKYTPLSEILSYNTIPYWNFAIHLAPASDLNTGEKFGSIKEGLRNAALIIQSRPHKFIICF